MSKVFISYRHSDERGAREADRLAEALRKRFGVGNIFYDLESLPAGANWREHAAKGLDESQIVLAVIGPGWGDLHDPDDPIRFELEIARQKGLTILPVLVQGTRMPGTDALPESLANLPDVIASPIGSRGEAYRREVANIIAVIEQECGPTAERKTKSPVWRWLRNRWVQATLALFVAALSFVGVWVSTEGTLPARYTLKAGQEIWLNSEPRSCHTPFMEARRKAYRELGYGSAIAGKDHIKGKFDEPTCRNVCWMDSGSQVEIHEEVREDGKWVLLRVVHGVCDKGRQQEQKKSHDDWNRLRVEPDKFECCRQRDVGYAAWKITPKDKPIQEVFERDWWPWILENADEGRPYEPEWCTALRIAREFGPRPPNDRTLCEAPMLWGLEARRLELQERKEDALSGQHGALAALSTRHEAWLEERRACGKDVLCTGRRITERVHELERQ